MCSHILAQGQSGRHSTRTWAGRLQSACLHAPCRLQCRARKTRGAAQQTKPSVSLKQQESVSSSAWEFFRLEAYTQAEPWDVPWGWRTIIFGMLAWGVSFLLIGVFSVPIAANLLHVTNLRTMTPLQVSEVQLIDQVRASTTPCTCQPSPDPRSRLP
jgi:hypothetical protein